MNSYIQKRIGIVVAGCTFCLATVSLFRLLPENTFLGSFKDPGVWSVYLFSAIALWSAFHKVTIALLFQVLIPIIAAIATALDSISGDLTSVIFLGIGFALAQEYGFLKKRIVVKVTVAGVIYVAALVTGLVVIKEIPFPVTFHTLIGVGMVLYLVILMIRVGTARHNKREEQLEAAVQERTSDLNKKIEENMMLLKEKDLLLREVHHRTKNNMQLILSLINIEFEIINDPDVRESIEKSKARIYALSLAHDYLYKSTDITDIHIDTYIHDVITHLCSGISTVNNSLDIDVDKTLYRNIDFSIPLGLILNELVTNSIKHAFPGNKTGHISVKITVEDRKIIVRVRDDGIGLPDSVDPVNPSTTGIQLVSSLTEQLKGSMEIIKGAGADWRFSFPFDDGP